MNTNSTANQVARPIKLRSSCNACAEAKIGCTKEKPGCARCVRRGSTCVYAVTRRAGRPARKQSQQQQQAAQQQQTGDCDGPHLVAIQQRHDSATSISSFYHPSSMNQAGPDSGLPWPDCSDMFSTMQATDAMSSWSMSQSPGTGTQWDDFMASATPFENGSHSLSGDSGIDMCHSGSPYDTDYFSSKDGYDLFMNDNCGMIDTTLDDFPLGATDYLTSSSQGSTRPSSPSRWYSTGNMSGYNYSMPMPDPY